MTLAARLRRLLAAHGCTIAEAARRSGMDRQVAYRIAGGSNANPTVETLRRLVEAAGGTLWELFADDEPKGKGGGA